MVVEKKQIGQLLLESGLLNESQLKEALAYQRDNGLVFGKAVVKMGLVQSVNCCASWETILDFPVWILPNTISRMKPSWK